VLFDSNGKIYLNLWHAAPSDLNECPSFKLFTATTYYKKSNKSNASLGTTCFQPALYSALKDLKM
jgi:hypothetical protein